MTNLRVYLLLASLLYFLILGAVLVVMISCLRHREKLASFAIALAGMVAKFRRKPPARVRIESIVGQVLEGWDALLPGGCREPALGAKF